MDPAGSVVVGLIWQMAVKPTRFRQRVYAMGNDNNNNAGSGTMDPVGSGVVGSIRGGLVGARGSGEAQARSGRGALGLRGTGTDKEELTGEEGEDATKREFQGSKRGRGIALGRRAGAPGHSLVALKIFTKDIIIRKKTSGNGLLLCSFGFVLLFRFVSIHNEYAILNKYANLARLNNCTMMNYQDLNLR